MVSGGNIYSQTGDNPKANTVYKVNGTYTFPSDLSTTILVWYSARSENASKQGYGENWL